MPWLRRCSCCDCSAGSTGASRLEATEARLEPVRGLAQAFGPILGPQVARTVREGLRHGVRLAGQFGRDAAEYVTEESRDAVGKAELNAFHDEVDALRDRVERMAARVTRLRGGHAG